MTLVLFIDKAYAWAKNFCYLTFGVQIGCLFALALIAFSRFTDRIGGLEFQIKMQIWLVFWLGAIGWFTLSLFAAMFFKKIKDENPV